MYFGETIQHFDAYFWRHRGLVDVYLFNEIKARLRQLSRLYANVAELVDQLLSAAELEQGGLEQGEAVIIAFTNIAVPKNPSQEDYAIPSLEDVTTSEVLQINVEAFYYFAHKVILLCRQSGRLPGLQTFRSPGILRVRNDLIEHSTNKSKGQDIYSLTISRAAGPRLRTLSKAQKAPGYMDHGLWVNAEEFKVNFERVLP